MSGCLMLQSRGVDIKDSFLKFILPYQSFFFFFDRLLMMVTSYLVGKERLQHGWKMTQDKKFFLIKNKWPDTKSATECTRIKLLLLNCKFSTLSRRNLLPGSLISDGPQNVVCLPCPPTCTTVMVHCRVLQVIFVGVPHQ